MSDRASANYARKAKGSVAMSSEQPSTAPRPSETANSLTSPYQDLLEVHGQLEEEIHRRALALATLAHEIKNPLAIISGYIEMLLTRKVGPLTERQAKNPGRNSVELRSTGEIRSGIPGL